MLKRIKERVLKETQYTLDNNSTVRATAKAIHVSKSTVYKDLTERLPLISPELYAEVQVVLQNNKAERAIRGGAATKRKYFLLKRKH